MVADDPRRPPPPCPSWFRRGKPSAEKLYHVKRISDGAVACATVCKNGTVVVEWKPTAMAVNRAFAQAMAAVLLVSMDNRCMIIEEAE